jgi:hypothetical protein
MKLERFKPKAPKTVAQSMIWACAGMAYFNLFSSLELDPALQLGLSGVLPMAALIAYLLFKPNPPKSPIETQEHGSIED